jgi:hypothetical protein
MMLNPRSRNLALLRYLVLPFIFLTAVLLGGLRVSIEHHAFLFIPPSLIDLILAVMIFALAVRGGLLKLHAWLSLDQPTLTLISNFLTLLAFFFASAQSLNSVLPEQGLLHWMFALFFFWTLWNNQFSGLNPERTVRSLAVLFGTAFLLKHIIFSALNASDGSWIRQLAAGLIQGVVMSNADDARYASATGYISFFAIALFVCGLALLPAGPHEFEVLEDSVTLHQSQPTAILDKHEPDIPIIEGHIISDEITKSS